jgi:hypothetical protein
MMSGLRGERARDLDALPHAARQLARIGVLEALEPHHLHVVARISSRRVVAVQAERMLSVTVSQGKMPFSWKTKIRAGRAVDGLALDEYLAAGVGGSPRRC